MKDLSHEVTKEPNAIKKYVVQPMLECSRNNPMSETQGKYLLLGLHEDKEPTTDLNQFYNKMKSYSLGINLLEQRLERAGITITKSASIFLSLTLSTPSKAILYAIFITYMCRKHGITNLDCATLSIKIFPEGLFHDKDLDDVWQKQKVERLNDGTFSSDNLVDYPTAFMTLYEMKK